MSKKSPKYIKVLEVSEELFWKYGFNRITMDEIAKTAGVSKATIYNYFPTKDDLLIKVFENSVDYHMEVIIELLDKERHAFDKLEKLFSYSMEMAKGVSAVLIKDVIERTNLMEYVVEYKTKKVYHIWKTILEEGIREGEIRDLDVDFVSNLLLSMPMVLMRLDYFSDDDSKVRLYENLFGFMKYGLLGGLEDKSR